MAAPLFSRLDKHLIATHYKHHNNRVTRFFNSKPGFIITTLVALYKAADEAIESRDKGDFIMAGVLAASSLLLLIFSLRHIIWHKRIEHFEYRLKLLEAAIILYAGYEAFHRIAAREGYISVRPIGLGVCTIGLAALYCLQSRLYYLKKKNMIPHI